jgi:hypothetical protein
MYQSNLKLAKYEPLTFECVHCDQQFAVLGNSLERFVSQHINKNHPELLHSELPQKVA